jgi:hypothetical protein
MRDWYRVLRRDLAAPLRAQGTEHPANLLAILSAEMFHRRWDALRASHEDLPDRQRDPRAVGLLMGALYRVSGAPKAKWVFDGVGGPARSPAERVRAHVLLRKLGVAARWHEVATHLGELLIVLTTELPRYLPHARKILGDICFDAGAKYAEHVKKTFRIPSDVADPPASAMEILRMSEYVFRVNPKHWQESDGVTGWLEGTACPWYTRPGWNAAHCGIFGQFQSGIASTFGLRYHLSKTIPKHGGETCRVDVKPIPLRKKDEAPPAP